MKNILLVFSLLLILQNRCAAHTRPDYVVIQARLLWGWKIVHVDKPKKNLHKWHYDSKSDTYYRIRTIFGTGLPIKK